MFPDTIKREVLIEKCLGVISDWKDDLIWCPSQCYLKIKYKDRKFVLYLRWRHRDPWSADLVECRDSFDISTSMDEIWHSLKIDFFIDKELDKCKKNAFKIAMKLIKSGVL